MLKNVIFIFKYFKRHTTKLEPVAVMRAIGFWIFHGVVGTSVFFLLWELVSRMILSKPGFEQFSGFMPDHTLRALGQLFLEEEFWDSLYASLRRVCVGIAIAFVIGIPFGLLIGFYKRLEQTTYTPIQFLRMISPLSWMPVALLLFNSFESAIYFLVAMATVWPIVINTSHGVANVNPKWIDMARNQGANNRQLMFQVIVPASVPFILTSLRLALGVAWIVLVPAEYLGVTSGLGYFINDARDTMEYDRLMAIIVAIGIVGFVIDGTIQLIQKSFNWSWA